MRAAILLTLTLLSAPAAAGEVGRYGNEGGGAIVLTDIACPNAKNTFRVYSYTNRTSMQGCWLFANKEVVVQWDDGALRFYPISDLEFSEEFKREVAARRERM